MKNNSTVRLNYNLLDAGYCTQSEYVSLRGQHRTIHFPATFALLKHPRLGVILFDTGYSFRFYEETRHFPYNLYAKVTPVNLSAGETAVEKLQARGIGANEVRYIIISHFHADHIGGLIDFPQAIYIYFKQAFEAVSWRRGVRAVSVGFLPGLIPVDFESRSQPIELPSTGRWLSLPKSQYAPFEQGVDLFGDQSLIAVMLPGHATGQMGLFFMADNGERYFLVADGCWHSRSYRECILPHPIVRLFFADWPVYCDTLKKIHQFHREQPQVHIIPTHCNDSNRNRISNF